MSRYTSVHLGPGTVTVTNPGAAAGPDARRFVAAVEANMGAAITARARNYARAGRVGLPTVTAGESLSAYVTGSDRPYRTEVGGLDGSRAWAQCSCPYGCLSLDWCKHAGALGYVGAALLDGSFTGDAEALGPEFASQVCAVGAPPDGPPSQELRRAGLALLTPRVAHPGWWRPS